ncbi:Neurotransmitter-gated ion-channel transmembrane region, partial [Cichlidogyrus casuarinus]
MVTFLLFRSPGNYSRLVVSFIFRRSVGYYLIQIYLPSLLIVVISWISFWLRRDAVPARIALGITTVLTMTTLISSTNASLPKISYLKAIDVFLVTCFIMVFASLLEYAAVSYLSKKHDYLFLRHPQIHIDNYKPREGICSPNMNGTIAGRPRLETSFDNSRIWVNDSNPNAGTEENKDIWYKTTQNKSEHCAKVLPVEQKNGQQTKVSYFNEVDGKPIAEAEVCEQSTNQSP